MAGEIGSGSRGTAIRNSIGEIVVLVALVIGLVLLLRFQADLLDALRDRGIRGAQRAQLQRVFLTSVGLCAASAGTVAGKIAFEITNAGSGSEGRALVTRRTLAFVGLIGLLIAFALSGIPSPYLESGAFLWVSVSGILLGVVYAGAEVSGVARTEDELRATRAGLNETSTRLEEAEAELERVRTELEGTSTELRETEGELEETSARLERTERELEAASAALSEATSEADEARTELEGTNAELERTRAKLGEMSTDSEDAEAELEETRIELDETGAELAELKEKLGEASTISEETNVALAETEAELTERREEAADLRAELEETRAASERTAAELEETLLALGTTETELRETKAKLAETEGELERYEEEETKPPLTELVIESVPSDDADEVLVELTNDGEGTVRLGGCSMDDGDGTSYPFHEGFELDPGRSETFKVDRNFDIESDEPLTLYCEDEPVGRIRWKTSE